MTKIKQIIKNVCAFDCEREREEQCRDGCRVEKEIIGLFKDEKLTLTFKCGCFMICYVDSNLKLNAGLSCCKQHEHPYAKVEDYYLSNIEEPKK